MEVGEEEKNQLVVESALSQKLKNVPTPQIIINSKKKKRSEHPKQMLSLWSYVYEILQ